MSALEQNDGPQMAKGKTESGLEENLAGLLCYLFGFITGIIFMVLEKENRFVRFHALQSISISIVIIILNIIINFIPLLGFILSLILMPAAFILWIILMVKAYQSQWFKLPIIGDIVEKQLNSK